jgi:hypothetical protein
MLLVREKNMEGPGNTDARCFQAHPAAEPSRATFEHDQPNSRATTGSDSSEGGPSATSAPPKPQANLAPEAPRTRVGSLLHRAQQFEESLRQQGKRGERGSDKAQTPAPSIVARVKNLELRIATEQQQQEAADPLSPRPSLSEAVIALPIHIEGYHAPQRPELAVPDEDVHQPAATMASALVMPPPPSLPRSKKTPVLLSILEINVVFSFFCVCLARFSVFVWAHRVLCCRIEQRRSPPSSCARSLQPSHVPLLPRAADLAVINQAALSSFASLF